MALAVDQFDRIAIKERLPLSERHSEILTLRVTVGLSTVPGNRRRNVEAMSAGSVCSVA